MAVFDLHRNLALSTVATAPVPSNAGTSLVVAAGEGARFSVGPATVWPSIGLPDPLTAEVVRVTAIVGDTLTLLRTQEGSTARAILVGDLIAGTITAKSLTDIEAAITAGGPVLPHHLTHESGGSDVVTLAQSQITGLTSALTGKVDTTDPRLTNARTPTAHAPTHSAGQSDPVTVTALAGYPGGTTTFLRADGSFATPATGVPAAHHLTHETGGADAVVALSGAVITTGTVADARLSSNVPLKNTANTFTQTQTVNATLLTSTATAGLYFQDTASLAAQRAWGLVAEAQVCYLNTYGDNWASLQARPLTIHRNGNVIAGGGVYDLARGTAIGDWLSGPGFLPAVGGYTGSYLYAYVGHTVHLVIHTTNASPPSSAFIEFGIPSFASISFTTSCMYYVGAGWLLGSVALSAGASTFKIFSNTGANFPAAATQVVINIAVPIQ